ncbi:hypothetical protein [Spirosoma sp.]|uniref:hypothetical protein n=1 Tax=Spirosoma sp. TaxID=1899569 RepID=UPI003B3A27AB
MIKLMIGALLMATTALAQSPTTPSEQKRAGVKARPTGSTESTTRSGSKSAVSASTKPLPQPPLKEKLESGNKANPAYQQEKDAGVHKTKNRYSPRRTKSGARKDTTKKIEL